MVINHFIKFADPWKDGTIEDDIYFRTLRRFLA